MNHFELLKLENKSTFEPVGFLWRKKGFDERWKYESDMKQCQDLPECILTNTEIKIVYEKL